MEAHDVIAASRKRVFLGSARFVGHIYRLMGHRKVFGPNILALPSLSLLTLDPLDSRTLAFIIIILKLWAAVGRGAFPVLAYEFPWRVTTVNALNHIVEIKTVEATADAHAQRRYAKLLRLTKDVVGNNE